MPRRERIKPGARAAIRLEAALIERAINGVERRKVYANGTVETYTEFDNRFGLMVLDRLEAQLRVDTVVDRFTSPVTGRDEFLALIARYEAMGPDAPDGADAAGGGQRGRRRRLTDRPGGGPPARRRARAREGRRQGGRSDDIHVCGGGLA